MPTVGAITQRYKSAFESVRDRQALSEDRYQKMREAAEREFEAEGLSEEEASKRAWECCCSAGALTAAQVATTTIALHLEEAGLRVRTEEGEFYLFEDDKKVVTLAPTKDGSVMVDIHPHAELFCISPALVFYRYTADTPESIAEDILGVLTQPTV